MTDEQRIAEIWENHARLEASLEGVGKDWGEELYLKDIPWLLDKVAALRLSVNNTKDKFRQEQKLSGEITAKNEELEQQNAALEKVVDAAREYHLVPSCDDKENWLNLDKALAELDALGCE